MRHLEFARRSTEENQERTAMDRIVPKLFYYSGTPIDISGANPDTGTAFNFHLFYLSFMELLLPKYSHGSKCTFLGQWCMWTTRFQCW